MAAYVPTAGMLRELASCLDGEPAREMLEHQACRLRGLVDIRGRLTPAGVEALNAEIRRRRPHG